MKPYLTTTQYLVLQYLKRYGSGTIDDLARDLHYSPVWMSQVLRQLLWRGYVIRTNVRRAGWQWRYEAKEQAA